ncbi:MAG TPA: alpha/beta fold hydrolase [Acidimicrobiales bacterium]
MTDPNVDRVRTPDDRFEGIGWDLEPHYLSHPDGLRQHYVDERPTGAERGTFLLLHGEPTWAYLYRDMIGPLVAMGFRVVAPDHFGFGRSDKPTDDGWYTITRHRRALDHLVRTLDLRDIQLVVQDWGGPIGLCTADADLDRYRRAFILNTWLHEDGFEYSAGVRAWRAAALDPAFLGGDMPVGNIVSGVLARPGHDLSAMANAFDAPFTGVESKAGARRFPLCIPFAEPELGDAALQSEVRGHLRHWPLPVHVAFGDADPIFPWTWAEQWAAEIEGATLDRIEGAGHFVQLDAPADVLAVLDARLGA